MKIVLATPLHSPEIAEPAPYIKELTKHLRTKHEIVVVAYANTKDEVPGSTLITVNKQHSLLVRLVRYTLALYKASRDAEFIYVQDTLAAGLPAIIVGYSRKIPVIIRMVGDEAWERATKLNLTTKNLEKFLSTPTKNRRIRLIMRLQKFVLQHAQYIITSSEHMRNVVVHTYHIAKERTLVIYNPAQKAEVLPFGSPTVPHQIVVHAQLVPWKGIEGIIQATALLRKEFPDVRLLIAGNGPQEYELKALVQKHGISENVSFIGSISHAQRWHIHKSSQVSVIHSTHEDIPDAAFESFLTETPLVATDVPGINEAVYHEKTGLLVKTNNVQELAGAIKKLFKDDELSIRITENAQDMLTEKFSWEAHVTHLLQILNNVRNTYAR